MADEIIVTDTGSTDNTVEIAKSHGARIEYFTWTKNFYEAKNYSISKEKQSRNLELFKQ